MSLKTGKLNMAQQLRAPGAADRGLEEAALVIWHEEDERSLIRLVPDVIREAMLRLPENLRCMEERGLRERVKPSPTDNQIRLSFWLEYQSCQAEFLPRMRFVPIIRGICSDEYFRNVYLKNDLRVAWMTTPPVHYTVQMMEALDFGINRLREILELPLTDKKGKLNTQLARLMSHIVAQLETRVHGSVAHKVQIEQKTLHMDAKDVTNAIEMRNMGDIDKRLKFLEKREKMIEHGVHPTLSDTVAAKVLEKKEFHVEQDEDTILVDKADITHKSEE